MKFLALLSAIAIAACVGATGPDLNARCVNVGDTIGALVRFDSAHHITECIWLRSDARVCFDTPISKQSIHCVVGDTSWYGPRMVR